MDVSQNQTERFGLHLWEPEDNFLREEFNENFTTLDMAVAGKLAAVKGAYIGDRPPERYQQDPPFQTVDLGFTPRAVLLCNPVVAYENNAWNSQWIIAGAVTQGSTTASYYSKGEIIPDGFRVSGYLNVNGQTILYMAFA